MSSDNHKTVSDLRAHSSSEKNKFQSLFLKTIEKSQTEIERNLKTIEKSQTEIERNNRIKDSTAKDTDRSQPRVSELQKLQLGASRFAPSDAVRSQENLAQAHVESESSSHEVFIHAQPVKNTVSINLGMQNINAAELLRQNFMSAYSNDQDQFEPHAEQADRADRTKLSECDILIEDMVQKDTKFDPVLITLRPKSQNDPSGLEQREPQLTASARVIKDETKQDEYTSFVGQVQFNENNLLINQELSNTPQHVVQNRFGTDAWGTEFCKKIVWMVSGGEQSATLTLNPPNLGPIKVEVKMQNNIAHTVFESANADVRLALESGLVRLREMLALRGVELGQTSVKDEISKKDTNAQKNKVLNRLLNTFV
jgi:flagellar hook-length control protein FliK